MIQSQIPSMLQRALSLQRRGEIAIGHFPTERAKKHCKPTWFGKAVVKVHNIARLITLPS